MPQAARTKTVYLVRHGEPEEGYTGRFLGRLNPGLSPKGMEQAARAAARIAPLAPCRCLSSPLRRARDTAAAIAAACGLEVECSDLLLEIDFGLLEGKTFREASEIHPGITDSWQALSRDFHFPGGEDFAAYHRRVTELANRIRAGEEEKLLLVSHGGLLRGLLCSLLDVDLIGPIRFRFSYASPAVVKIDRDGGALLDAFNMWRDISPA